MSIFGSTKNFTPGQNLLRALFGVVDPKVSLGILDCDHDEVIRIFESSLEPIEVEILCRGFGIGREPETQKDIADELNCKATEVSKCAKDALNKLVDKKQELLRLVPGAREISSYKRDAIQFRSKGAELAEMELRRANFDKQLARRDKEIDELRKQVDELESKKQSAENLVRENQESRHEAIERCEQLEKEVAYLKQRRDNLNQTWNTKEDERAAAVNQLYDLKRDISSSTIELLTVSDRIGNEFKNLEACINQIWKATDSLICKSDETESESEKNLA